MLRVSVGLLRSYIVAEPSPSTVGGMQEWSSIAAVSNGLSKGLVVEVEASEGDEAREDEAVAEVPERWSTASKGGRKSALESSAVGPKNASSKRWWLQGDGGASGVTKGMSVTKGRKALDGGHARGNGGRFRFGRSALCASSKSQSTG